MREKSRSNTKYNGSLMSIVDGKGQQMTLECVLMLLEEMITFQCHQKVIKFLNALS